MRKVRMKRVGRYWIDKELYDEGYDIRDIFDDDPVIELPELFDRERRRHVDWMICPNCGELEQVDRRHLYCSGCEWEQDNTPIKRPARCAA